MTHVPVKNMFDPADTFALGFTWRTPLLVTQVLKYLESFAVRYMFACGLSPDASVPTV